LYLVDKEEKRKKADKGGYSTGDINPARFSFQIGNNLYGQQ